MTTDTVYYLRVNNGLDVLRIVEEDVSLVENDLSHDEWCLEPSLLSSEALASVHHFCAARGSLAPDWSVVAKRHF